MCQKVIAPVGLAVVGQISGVPCLVGALEFFLLTTVWTVLTAMFYGLYHSFQADRYVRAPPFMKLVK